MFSSGCFLISDIPPCEPHYKLENMHTALKTLTRTQTLSSLTMPRATNVWFLTNLATSFGFSKRDRQCWYFQASMQVFRHGPGTDIGQEMGCEAGSLPKTSGWMPSETCAVDGVHGDNLNERKKPQLGLVREINIMDQVNYALSAALVHSD